MIPVITIDGPSGSGKGTVGQLLAERLGWHFLDSGALYRILGYVVLTKHIRSDDVAVLQELALNLHLKFVTEDSNSKIYWQDQDITQNIRSSEVGLIASEIAVLVPVREALLERQRAFRHHPGLVADGRDMGTVVFPDAILKVFLTASCEERANRRFKQLQQSGINVSLRTILQDLCDRDARDQQRAVAPLKPANDAIVIDTTKQSIDDVVEKVMELAQQRLELVA